MMMATCLNARDASPVADEPKSDSLHALVKAQAEVRPTAPAILTPGRAPLSYGRLVAHIEEVAAALAGMGFGRNDRIALVLPNSPEAATAFLAVGACATCAPLNPAYRENEFDFYLSDLEAKAMIVRAGESPAARRAAEARGVPILDLEVTADCPAGVFRLTGAPPQPQRPAQFARGSDEVLVLHTSGTTSRPKIVPLTHANLCASAANIGAVLKLTAEDRGLNVMPLFHIHGLMAALVSSLAAGASVVCGASFQAVKFFEWLAEFQPSWYTAVPTMHQAILAEAPHHRETVARSALRFIRSSSAPLPVPVLEQLEDVFKAPVVEAYGMTEACHQMCCNPLPPRQRKAGSVGPAAGPEVGIMDAAGNLLPRGHTGEVVIRGTNVTPGYQNNPDANRAAFTHGWFRTGDQGHQDADGYLFLTGRIKEIINRGGEKIAPVEIDSALLAHPAVAQAVAFAAPHRELGEEVAAAVVLRPGHAATEAELRTFVSGRLAHFKVPRRILLLKELPKGPTGKLQRIGLAQKLGLTAIDSSAACVHAEHVAPHSEIERQLVEIWQEILGVDHVGIKDDFFLLGGTSLMAANLRIRIEKTFGKQFPVATLFERPTIEQLAGALAAAEPVGASSLVPLQTGGARAPLFLVHGIGGDVMSFGALARHWRPEQPLYALQARSPDAAPPGPTRIEDLAEQYLADVRRVQPHGPYYLGGVSFGAAVAYEMAQQLQAQGEPIALLALVDHSRRRLHGQRGAWRPAALLRFLGNIPSWIVEEVIRGGVRSVARRVRTKTRALIGRLARLLRRGDAGRSAIDQSVFDTARLPEQLRRTLEVHYHALNTYQPRPYPGRLTVIRAQTQPLFRLHEHDLGWGDLAGGGVDIVPVPGNHNSILRDPHARSLAAVLLRHVQSAQSEHQK